MGEHVDAGQHEQERARRKACMRLRCRAVGVRSSLTKWSAGIERAKKQCSASDQNRYKMEGQCPSVAVNNLGGLGE